MRVLPVLDSATEDDIYPLFDKEQKNAVHAWGVVLMKLKYLFEASVQSEASAGTGRVHYRCICSYQMIHIWSALRSRL